MSLLIIITKLTIKESSRASELIEKDSFPNEWLLGKNLEKPV